MLVSKYACLFVIITCMLMYIFVLPVVYYVSIRAQPHPSSEPSVLDSEIRFEE